MSILNAVEAVERGVEWLTSEAEQGNVSEHWFWDIDLYNLDMINTTQCVLGQLFEKEGILAYKRGEREYHDGYGWATSNLLDDDCELATELGFDVYNTFDFNFTELTAAWREIIAELREQFPRP